MALPCATTATPMARPTFQQDGGGFSNNPSINILNLGKPSVCKVAFVAGPGVTRITINLKYM